VAYNGNATDIKICQGLKIPRNRMRLTTLFSAAVSQLGETYLKDDYTATVKKF
jgi:NifU-like protein involved in Fe-S cluster formation